MAAWFECKVTYEKVADNGMPKKVVESYLVDADSFTLAEAKMIEEITLSSVWESSTSVIFAR